MEVTIRDATPSDADTIADFNNRMAEETEGKRLAPHLIENGVRRLLDDSANGRYWVAEADGRRVGQIMVTYEWSDWRDGRIWWIQSVYVHPDARRKGVFSSLYRHVETLAQADPDACGIRLYVDESNTRAQQTYNTLGMIRTNYRIMETMFGHNDELGDPSC